LGHQLFAARKRQHWRWASQRYRLLAGLGAARNRGYARRDSFNNAVTQRRLGRLELSTFIPPSTVHHCEFETSFWNEFFKH